MLKMVAHTTSEALKYGYKIFKQIIILCIVGGNLFVPQTSTLTYLPSFAVSASVSWNFLPLHDPSFLPGLILPQGFFVR